MKKYIFYSLCATIAFGSVAATKTDIGSRARLRGKQAPLEVVKSPAGELKMAKRMRTRAAEDETVRAFITVEKGTKASQLEEAGVTVHSLRGSIAIAEFRQGDMAAVEALECVKSIRTEAPLTQKMDLTRTAIGADKVHSGEGLPRAYTGKGVIAGIVDGGFDPNHINFEDADGNNRIKQFTVYQYGQDMSGQQRVEVATFSGDKLKTIDTEASDSYHATHTTGIMAGSYRGQLKTGNVVDIVTGEVKDVDVNPYYGVAYDADIVASGAIGGQLSDYFIALGCESILDYAYEHNQPVALNLSLGSNVGPHDGSSVICRYLDEIIADDQVNTVICIAAGNEGDQPIALTKTMTVEDTQIGSFIHPAYSEIKNGSETFKNPRAGLIYIYSDTAEPFEIQAQIFNKQRKTVSSRFPIPVAEGEDMSYQYWVSSAEWQQEEGDKIDMQFAKYFEGYIGLAAQKDPDSGRYFSVIDFTCWDSKSNSTGNYLIGFQITGKNGQRIDVYGDGGMTYFSGEGFEGYSDGGFDGTINDIACGKNTIIVGSYTTRNHWGSLDGEVYGYWDVIPANQMTAFTSFGKLIDGRELPHICAPGAAIISSSNKYYIDEQKLDDNAIQARVAKNGRMHDFHQSIGTSMAAPVVTGTVALWLEANPELKASEVRDIMMRTAIRDEVVTNTGDPLQWGAGKIDAYEGLKEVLKASSSVSEISADGQQRVQVRRCGARQFDILVPGAKKVEAKVYSVAGACVLNASADGNELTLDASSLMPGVYVVTVNNASIKISIN